MRRTLIVAATAFCWISAAHAQEQKPIRIGVLSDFQGLFSDFTGRGSQIGAQMAVDEFGGKVLNRPVEVVIGDHQNKADIGANIARKWYDLEGVEMITDVIGSSVGLAVQEVARTKNKIAMYSGSGAVDLFGKSCAPGGFVWSINTYSMATVAGQAMVDEGADSWYIVSQDSAFGRSLEADLQSVLKAKDAKVLGISHFPITNQDFAPFLMNAQASKAKVIALTAGDIPSAMKQAQEFGILAGGQKVTSLMVWIHMVHSMGLPVAKGLYVTSSFYWDLNDETRAFAKKFFDRAGFMPSMTQAGSYSATKHYLKAVQKAGTTDTSQVLAVMREMPVEDATAKGRIRPDGLLARDFYLFQVKAPAESKSEWDLYKLVRTVDAVHAVPPLDRSECPLVRK
jgi:branched-chain amino acid transport system substrate-binding protein